IELLDPTPALLGNEAEVLATGTTDANGDFELTGIETDSSAGLLLAVQDCEDAAADTVLATANGIATADYADLGDGDTLADMVALSINVTMEAGIDLSLALTPYSADAAYAPIRTAGILIGATRDGATSAPIGGVTIDCTIGTCPYIYYMDTDPTDGMFTTGATLNTATEAAAGALFMAPAGPIGNWEADDGGTNQWEDQLGGSQPGYAVIIALYTE
ncbi:MAG: hypothetical protein HN348_26225, partial [Proteobacteria bacterium]|nr:hypothetical protein [Pseudomonadota bacterium]